MKAALHSDIGHAGNKGEDKKLDMTLSNLDYMRRKTEVYMSSQRKSFVAGLEKKQGTWIRQHERTASKSNNQAKLRKENRQKAAEEEARKAKEKKEREEKELDNERKIKESKMAAKMFTRKQLAPRKSMLPSIDDIYEPVETPPPPKETKSVTFRKLARAIGMASISFGKMVPTGEGEGSSAESASLFQKKVSAALGQEEKLSFSNLVMKIKVKQQMEQRQAALATIHEKELKEESRKKEERARERQRKIAEQQKLPPLLRRGSVVSSILKEVDDREEKTEEIMKQEPPVLSGPDPILISEVLPKIEIVKDIPQLPPDRGPTKRRRRRSRRRTNDLTKSKGVNDPLKDERFIKLQHLLKPELKKKETELSGLTTNILAAKKYARWWKAGALNAASEGQ